MNGSRRTYEINRARDEIARLADCLHPRRVRAFSRPRLFQVQTDLAMLTSHLGEIQRIVSKYLLQSGPNTAIVDKAVPSTVRPSISFESESTIAVHSRNSNPNVLMVEPTQNGHRKDSTDVL